MNNDLNFTDIVNLFWKNKIFIILITAFFAISSVFYALSLSNKYESSSLLTVSQSNSSSSLSSFSGQLGGIASIAGIDIPKTPDAIKLNLSIEIIKSKDFFKYLVNKYEFMPEIFAAMEYDKSKNKIIFDNKIYDEKNKKWIREPRSYLKSEPSYLEAHPKFLSMIKSSRHPETGYLRLSFTHPSPIFAKEVLDIIFNEVNNILRTKDLQRSIESLDFLNNQLSKTNLQQLRDSIGALTEQQLNTQMFASINKDYAISYIDPPFVPEKKSEPARAIICITITFFGFILSCIVVMIRHYVFQNLENILPNN